MEDEERRVLVELTRVATIADGIREDMAELKATVIAAQSSSVPRGEWVQRNNLVDGKFTDMGREISGLRTKHETDNASMQAQLDARRIPWYQSWSAIASIAAVIVAGIAIMVSH